LPGATLSLGESCALAGRPLKTLSFPCYWATLDTHLIPCPDFLFLPARAFIVGTTSGLSKVLSGRKQDALFSELLSASILPRAVLH